MKRTAAVMAGWLLAMAARGELYEFGGRMVDIEYWTGAGAREAVCVVTFDDDHTYAFGYRWDGDVTGLEMLQAIADGGGMDIVVLDFGFGDFVDQISYDGTTGGGAWPTDWLGYFLSDDGVSWTDSGAGAADRVVPDRGWDGWAVQPSDSWPPEVHPLAPPDYSFALWGREYDLSFFVDGHDLTGIERNSRNLVAVLRHDGALNVLALACVYYGRDRTGAKYIDILDIDRCSLARAGRNGLTGVMEDDTGPGARLAGTLTASSGRSAQAPIRSLTASLVSIARNDTDLEGFSRLSWRLGTRRRGGGPASLDGVLNLLAADGYPDPRQ